MKKLFVLVMVLSIIFCSVPAIFAATLGPVNVPISSQKRVMLTGYVTGVDVVNTCAENPLLVSQVSELIAKYDLSTDEEKIIINQQILDIKAKIQLEKDQCIKALAVVQEKPTTILPVLTDATPPVSTLLPSTNSSINSSINNTPIIPPIIPPIVPPVVKPNLTVPSTQCTTVYQPVCGQLTVQVQCIRAPCPPIIKTDTYANFCTLGLAGATLLYVGECKNATPIIVPPPSAIPPTVPPTLPPIINDPCTDWKTTYLKIDMYTGYLQLSDTDLIAKGMTRDNITTTITYLKKLAVGLQESCNALSASLSASTTPVVYATATSDDTPRIAYWYGKVNQHVEITTGIWTTDADGVSGASINKLTYCRKFYPKTSYVQSYKMEKIEHWKNKGNVADFVLAVITDRCVQSDRVYVNDSNSTITPPIAPLINVTINTTINSTINVTINSTTNSTSMVCPSVVTDSDGGNNIYVKGTSTYYVMMTPGDCVLKTLSDYCVDNTHLWEFNGRSAGIRNCPTGCVDGACVLNSNITQNSTQNTSINNTALQNNTPVVTPVVQTTSVTPATPVITVAPVISEGTLCTELLSQANYNKFKTLKSIVATQEYPNTLGITVADATIALQTVYNSMTENNCDLAIWNTAYNLDTGSTNTVAMSTPVSTQATTIKAYYTAEFNTILASDSTATKKIVDLQNLQNSVDNAIATLVTDNQNINYADITLQTNTITFTPNVVTVGDLAVPTTPADTKTISVKLPIDTDVVMREGTVELSTQGVFATSKEPVVVTDGSVIIGGQAVQIDPSSLLKKISANPDSFISIENDTTAGMVVYKVTDTAQITKFFFFKEEIVMTTTTDLSGNTLSTTDIPWYASIVN